MRNAIDRVRRAVLEPLRNKTSFLLIVALLAMFCSRSAIAQTDSTATADSSASSAAGQSDAGQTTGTQGVAADETGGTQQASGETGAQPVMSADQIIGILRDQPDLLVAAKDTIARLTNVDPSTISDDSVFSHIQQDPNLRAELTQELNKRGYSTNVSQGAATASVTSGTASAAKTSKPSAPEPAMSSNRDMPQPVQQPDPYKDLPSLHDLYTQIPPAGGTLQRFGSNAFLVGTGNANELPMDLPVGPDYVLGPGDNIAVNMWGGRSQRLNVTIDRQGELALPEAGTVNINGLTITQAESAIQKALSTQFQDEHVEISLGRLRTVRVYVVGDVQRPGAYDVSSLSTALSALYTAGGPTSRGSLRVLRHLRGNELVRTIDLYDFLLRGVHSDTDRLLPGDTILVPPAGPEVTVEGMVHRPAIYELNGEQNLNQVLDLAGGVLISASLKQVNVQRIEEHERRTMVSLELPNTADAIRQKLVDFHVQAGDDVVISQILPYNQAAVYLEGHVFRPGKYAYKDGMTVEDLLHSYQDVMPEPSDHVELVRLRAPDFRPETMSLSLANILIGNAAIPLQPFDLVRIFGRYEIDVPKVYIEGEVLRPGDYPMSQGLTAAGLVRMAGGFKRSAYEDEADISSYTVENGEKVLLGHTAIDLKAALDGDVKSDVPLKPGDVVSIRELAGWQDIGASVSLGGEVEHPGTYGITEGERLSSVIKRAGGFRESAYPAAAILQRVQVRELGEQSRQQMIQRIETTPIEVKAGTMSIQDQTTLEQSMQQQKIQVLAALRAHPASGRQVISISTNIASWANTPADIEMRNGDSLVVPKRPTFVIVSGQVYNSTAISFVPGRTAGWYLEKAGGVTPSGDKKNIYILRADGSIVGHGSSWMNGSFLGYRMRPGDSIVVPEKVIGGSMLWRNLLGTAQILSSAALPLAIAGVY